MSKKIRVGWDDLKPGDLIPVKGSTEELLEVNKQTPILELLSAEEYYTRKAKGEL